MKKVLLTLLGVIVVLGILAGAGFVGYRIGFNQAARAFAVKKATATTQVPPQGNGVAPRGPMQNFNQGFGPRNMPMFRNFGNGFGRGFNGGMGPGGFGMMPGRGRGFGFFAPFQFLIHVAIWGLVIWLIYLAIKGSGWRLTRQPAQSAPVAAPVVEPKSEQSE
jgi:hypothetical protein